MMETIWKEKISLATEQKIWLPSKHKILCVQMQLYSICIWFKCDPKSVIEQRTFYVYGTGHEYPEIKGQYIGTVQQVNGPLVWHIFIEE